MPCIHKFFGHHQHQRAVGLLPNWRVKSLIIGTFNPSNDWVERNNALYFYGRSEYFWCVLPRFFRPATPDATISNLDVDRQVDFLTVHQIGLTDLLISINDADIGNPTHIARIDSYRDDEIEKFSDFTWNTENIISYIEQEKVTCVFFTRKGDPRKSNPRQNTFEAQMRIIESFCDNNSIRNHRLHTPSGMGLGKGAPKENKLTHKWFFEGAYDFQFRLPNFQLSDYPWEIKYNNVDDYF